MDETHNKQKAEVQARELSYNLHSLGWKAFQDLCITILSEVWGQTIQTFFDSQDGGRDGAFHGIWETFQGEFFKGTFTVQCKFTSKHDKTLKLSDLKDEFTKARRLSSRGLADNYILMTNAHLTGNNDEKMREIFEAIPGINRFAAYGSERISQIIRDSSRLRMLVPRVYGLGDLGQILDERAYVQAAEILSAVGDDLGKFVITEAFKKSAKALVEHGFVLLLGEPACGKSTIAASLAVGALDEWGCSTLKVCDADDFKTHWNPHEPKQFFWVDDAFGTTQIDWTATYGWNRLFPHIQAAIKKGAKIVFTSRDYIYRTAKNVLKESALPIMRESQVVINVQKIPIQEREQILYNHIKLGTQLQKFKSKIKSHLAEIASHKLFSPEIARRLGNSMFTRRLSITKGGLDNFVSQPLDLLLEIIRTLDAESRSALALIFMRAGILPSPIDLTEHEQQAIKLLGGTIGGIRNAINSMNESLVAQSFEGEQYFWRYKHPTIRDAFATLVSDDSELMDIYIAGSPLDKLFKEVSCGDVGIDGVRVIIPRGRYEALIKRIESFDTTKWHNAYILNNFLARRCDRNFLESFISYLPEFILQLKTGGSISFSDYTVFARFHKFGLLPELERLRAVNAIKELSVAVPDAGFLSADIRELLTSNELNEILQTVENELLPNIEDKIDEWQYEYDGDRSPEDHFYELVSALQDYKIEFEENDIVADQIDSAIEKINMIVDELMTDFYESQENDNSFNTKVKAPRRHSTRSIFDDVDR